MPLLSKDKGPDYLRVVAVAGVYFLAGKLGLLFAFTYSNASPVWPPAGIALAAMLVLGRRVWPGVLAGACLLGFVGARNAGGSFAACAAASLMIGAGNTLEALAGAWLLERFARGREFLRQPQSIFLFVLMAGIAATAIGATFGTISATLAGFETGFRGHLWVTWWVGDMASITLLTPLIVAWATSPWPRLTARRWSEAAALLLTLLVLCDFAFSGWVTTRMRGAPLAFLIVPILVWTALRFAQRATASVVFLVTCIAIAATVHRHGPFVLVNINTSLLLLQNFVVLVTVMSLILAADVAQRRHTDAGLLASEQRYRAMFEGSPQPMWVVDYENLRFLAVNNAAIAHYGYSREEFLGLRVTDIRPPEDVPRLLAQAERARTGLPISPSWRHRKKDGTVIAVEVSLHNLIFDGRAAVLVLSADVTERKWAEARAAAFSELGRRLGASRTSRDAATIIMETADKLFGWDACTLNLCSAGPDLMDAVWSMDTVDGKRTETPIGPTQPGQVTLRTLEQGSQLILRPAPAAFSSDTIPFGDQGRASSSLMYVPLRIDNKKIGVISIQSYSANAYTHKDLLLLQDLADHCAGSLDRIRGEQEIDRLNRELRRHVEELELLLNVAPVGIAVARDPECRVITTNPAAAAVLGPVGNGSVNGNGSGPPHGNPRILREGKEIAPEQLPVQRAARQGEAVRGEELEIVRPDGRVECYYASASPLYDEAGRVRGSLGVFVDLSERKHAQQEILRLTFDLERRVRERTALLEAANRELETFCYSVSHDLRAPLRSIRGFSEVLLQRYGSKLEARGQQFLQRACESCARMDHLIDDLLNLSRVGRVELHRQKVDLTALAKSIVTELRRVEPDRTVRMVIAPGLQASGDERLLGIVLENLLGNAWKFTSKQPKARIEFEFEEKPQAAFVIRDNGAGFDMTHAEKLFGVFQRLHSESEFPGTGVGLATVQRIVHRHGGRVWAQGAVEQGATFHFTLPDDEDS